MASKFKTSEGKERQRLPTEQQRELDKDGRCRRIFCDILRLRVLTYIVRQPTPFTFILSLFLISVTLPLVGLYISREDDLPDLDAMQNWNAYIGRLGRTDFWFNVSMDVRSGTTLYDVVNEDSILSGLEEMYTVGVMINFIVNRTVLASTAQIKQSLENQSNLFLYGKFSGNHFTTQIKDSKGERIDDKILIHFLLNTSSVDATEGDAVPTRLPQVHHDATFMNKVYGAGATSLVGLVFARPIFWGKSGANRRPKECSFNNGSVDLLKTNRDVHVDQSVMMYYDIREPVKVRNITFSSKTRDRVDGLYLPGVQRGASKGHGIIRINLNWADQQTAANHMYIAALAVAAIAIAFAVSITFTDRPLQPKSSQE